MWREIKTYRFFDKSGTIAFGEVQPPPIRFNGDAALQVAVNWLINPVNAASCEFWQSPVGQSKINDHRWVACEFIREFEDRDFSYCKIPKYMKKQDKEIVKAEAQLWGTVWNALKRLPAIPTGSIKPEPADVLFRLVNEHALMSFNYYEKVEGKEKLGKSGKEIKTGKTGIIRRQRSYNKALNGQENPFDRDRYPESWVFIDNSLVYAGRSKDFYSNFYLKIIDARVKVLNIMDGLESRCRNGEGVLERRGRNS